MDNAIEIKSLTDTTATIRGYAVVYGGRDLEGDTFTPDTDLAWDYVPTKAVLWDHALDEDVKDTPLGTVTASGTDTTGRWIEAQLDRATQYGRYVVGLIERGVLGLSTGSVAHLTTKAAGAIKRWPVVEVSLTPTPAEPRTLGVRRLKALVDAHPELKARLEAAALEADAADASDADAEPVTTKSFAGVLTMSENITPLEAMPPVDVAAIARQAAADAVKAYQAMLAAEEPTVKGAAKIAAEPIDHKPPFKTLGEQLIAVRNSAFGRHDNRLDGLKAILGGNESVPSDGGFLVSTAQDSGLERKLWDVSQFASRADRVTIPQGSNAMDFYGISENSRANGSRYGGITGYRMAEGQTITASGPQQFYRYTLKPKKYGALAYLTDEVIADASVIEQELTNAVPQELAFMLNDDMFRGLGAAGALGILSSAALITAAAVVGQDADTVLWENVLEMWNRRWPGGNYVWFVNQEVEAQLDQMVQNVGLGGIAARFVDYGPTGALRLKGAPVVTTEYNAALGNVGDILLADWSQYKLATIGGVNSASSMHVQFLTDQMCYRFTLRADGQCKWHAPLTPYQATANRTVSPFVVLAAR